MFKNILHITPEWLNFKTIICSFILVLNNIIPLLICIAFFTVAERKVLASLQRRFGPNQVGYWGLLQAIADGFKLINKEILIPTKVNLYLYFLAPTVALFLSFFGWAFLPLSTTSIFFDDMYSVLILLAISSLNVYTVIIAGWSSNSKYSFLGGLRSSAQMISYEVSISICLLPVFLSANSISLTEIVAAQTAIIFLFPMLPVAIIFFVSVIAETNRAPFDLPEAEAELVAGFNLEYSSIVFAFFFLAEYGNIILMSGFFSILFLGGWLPLFGILNMCNPIIWMAFKTIICCCLFILIRGCLPRYRYDQLMFIGWKIFLPMSLSFFFCFVSWMFLLKGIPFATSSFNDVNSLTFINLINKPAISTFFNESEFLRSLI